MWDEIKTFPAYLISQIKLGKMFKQATSTALHDIAILQEEVCVLLESHNMERGSAYRSSRNIHPYISSDPENTWHRDP